MAHFGSVSSGRLNTCDQRLQDLFREVVERYDCAVLCGHRTKEEQEVAVADGVSWVNWPYSKHNRIPSLAVDVAPLVNGGIDWDGPQHERTWYHFAGYVLATAQRLGIRVRWGGDWNGNLDLRTSDEGKRRDLPHWELLE